MKRIIMISAALFAAATLFSCAKDHTKDINRINERLDDIENVQISSLDGQVKAIQASIPELKKTDTELKGYITSLQTTAKNLQERIDAADGKIADLRTALDKAIADAAAADDALKSELIESIKSAKADVLAQLEAAKSAMTEQLNQINTTITSLQGKDAELEQKIAALRTYTDTELQNTKDWALATFATLAQYNALAGDIATIKENIALLNSAVDALQNKIAEEISEEIKNAVAPVKSEIVNEVTTEVTNTLNKTIADTKSEIKAAYTADIAKAISALETSMKSWVNEQLAGYYTIAQTDSKLAVLKSDLEAQLTSQKTYLENLVNSLSRELNGKIDANKTLIDALRSDVTSLQGTTANNASAIADNADKIAENARKITANTANITANANDIDAIEKEIAQHKTDMEAKVKEIEQRLTQIGADITSINNEIAAVRSDYAAKIAALQTTFEAKITENKQAIAANKKSIDNNAKLIAENKQAINALKTSTETAIAKNAAAIATNASNIAQNASLISANATAIDNNANAIATNAADIAQLQQDLQTTKTEITEAYTAAINTAITTLDGKLSKKLADDVATLNSRIDSEVAYINETITALTARVTTLEKEVKAIKVAILDMQEEIADIQKQIAAILARVQSVKYVPQYSDGNATMYYTNSAGLITAGSATLDFEMRPASTATDIAALWESALSVKAVYTQTRAVELVPLTIESATAKDGILSLVVSGKALKEEFFRSQTAASIRLEISDSNNCLTSDYVNIVPWTTDNIYIPDAVFKAYLVENFDTDGDHEISADEAAAVKTIDIGASLQRASSLAGIEYFTNLETLDCTYNKVAKLDLSANTKLSTVKVGNNKMTSLTLPASVVTLDASGNSLTTIDTSVAAGLKELNLSYNSLVSLNVAQNKALTSLDVTKNSLSALDVTKLRSLQTLHCGKNAIAQLDLSQNTALTDLDCQGNTLAALNLTKNTELVSLDCGENSLTALHLGSAKLTAIDCANNALTSLNLNACTVLASLDCSHNALRTLELAKCAALATLDCSHNSLQSLNVSANAALATLDCSANADLAKLWVKNATQQGAIATTKDDATIIYYNDGGLNIPDAKLKAYLVANYDDDFDGEISIAEADNITMVNCSNKGIADLTGLEACTNLVSLDCSNNSIARIYLPSLTKLTTLKCFGNPVQYLNLDNCSAIAYIYLMNVSTNAVRTDATDDSEEGAIKWLSIDGFDRASTLTLCMTATGVQRIDMPNSTVLQTLDLADNDILNLRIAKNTALTSVVLPVTLTKLNCNECSALQGIDVAALGSLKYLSANSCDLQSLSVKQNMNLQTLYCNSNSIASLDVTDNAALETLECSDNKLAVLNLTRNEALAHLDVSGNLLSSLNTRSNPALTYLAMSRNAEISVVNVKNNVALTDLYAENLAVSEINLSNNHALTNANVKNNTSLHTIIIWDEFTKPHDSILHFDNTPEISIIDVDGNNYGYPYIVGRYIPWNNGGVVYEADESLLHGKLISVSETSANWYDAKTWCNNYGASWYLPGIDQLRTIYKVKDTFNATLSAYGYITIGTDSYWSSTENTDGKHAYTVSCSNGNYYYNSNRSSTYNVRAVRAF